MQATQPLTQRQRVNLRRRNRARTLFEVYLMLSPFLILFAVFVIWPILYSLYLSFTEFNAIRAPQWVGLENFGRLLQDGRFHKAIVNTLSYVALVVSLTTVLGLSLALVFRKSNPFNNVIRTLFFLPSVTSSIALGLLWRWIFTGEAYGLANTFRDFLNLPSVTFLANPNWTLPVLVIMAVWGGMGYTMILFLAGLNAIPPELHEAAAIDGASVRQRFWAITLPLLRPTMLFVVVTGMIGAFQVFDAVYIVFRSVESIGGVLDSGLMIVPYLYDRGFNRFQLGYASAIAWVLFMIIFLITLVNLRVGRTSEVY